MNPTATKVGHGLAKVFNIKLDYRNEHSEQERISRGESVFSVSSADTYVEEEPSSLDWLRELVPTRSEAGHFFWNMFPFTKWIHRYNGQWLAGDLVAGITIGAVVVPQSMAYAQLASLNVEFGLYSAFMGTIIYWLFATSKDITIGPVAVMSQLVGGIVLHAQDTLPQYFPYQIAECLAIIVGAIIFAIGFLRLGFIVEFISTTAVSAFITGAALNILVGQVPGLLGLGKPQVNNRDPTYIVIIDTLKSLKYTKLDAALGLTALVMLYLYREICNFFARKYPAKAKMFFFISTLRTALVILLYTMISWLGNIDEYSYLKKGKNSKYAKWKILGHVPRGFQDAGVPTVNKEIITNFASQLPAAVIVLLIEHIAIAKSFGRINNYTINPSQEMLAIGVTNLLGPFVGAYPATGSFSRTAIKSKAGVRTPFAGVYTGIVVLLAIYALPAVFFWIPSAALSAVIIHAVGDLILPPDAVYRFWKISPLEVFVFFLGVIVTVFSTIEDGIYTTISVSAAILLFRIAKARGRFLGKVKIHSVIGDHLINGPEIEKGNVSVQQQNVSHDEGNARTVFLPIDHLDGSNPEVDVQRPAPGVFIYRLTDGFSYPNVNHYMDHFVRTVFAETKRTNPATYGKPGDRPWNDPGPRKGAIIADDPRPTLKAIILDFSSVHNIDVTVVQTLIDIRNQLDRYASPNRVEWHFACVNSRWAKRGLVAGGFGYPSPENDAGEYQRWKPVFSVAEIGGSDSAAAAAQTAFNKGSRSGDIESSHPVSRAPGKVAVVHGINRPFFHLDVAGALESVTQSLARQETYTVHEYTKTSDHGSD